MIGMYNPLWHPTSVQIYVVAWSVYTPSVTYDVIYQQDSGQLPWYFEGDSIIYSVTDPGTKK